MKFVYNDGGRKASGFKGEYVGDCVCRAISIASGIPYADVYKALNAGGNTERLPRAGKGSRLRSTARNGVFTHKAWFKRYMTSLGARWVPTMGIGTGCTVHVRKDELPSGRLVLMLSQHCAAFIDGVIHDLYDCSRGGTRCVYGYWVFPDANRV